MYRDLAEELPPEGAMEALRCKFEAGVAQGDPGSGSLFLIVIEGLLRRITAIDGVTLVRGYADDIAILFRPFQCRSRDFRALRLLWPS